MPDIATHAADPNPRPEPEKKPYSTFAEHQYRPIYAFPGIAPFVDAEADRRNFRDYSLRSKVKTDWFINQVSNTLGNACFQRKPADIESSIERAKQLREILSVAVAAMDAAIAETASKLGLADPPIPPDPEPADGPRHVRRPKHPGK